MNIKGFLGIVLGIMVLGSHQVTLLGYPLNQKLNNVKFIYYLQYGEKGQPWAPQFGDGGYYWQEYFKELKKSEAYRKAVEYARELVTQVEKEGGVQQWKQSNSFISAEIITHNEQILTDLKKVLFKIMGLDVLWVGLAAGTLGYYIHTVSQRPTNPDSIIMSAASVGTTLWGMYEFKQSYQTYRTVNKALGYLKDLKALP